MSRELVALLGDQEMARVYRDSRGRLSLEYADDWRTSDEAHPLSLSMPLTMRRHGHRVVSAFLWGLLPDSSLILDRWAKRFHVSLGEPFGLLSYVGADCAGAVRFTRPEQVEAPSEGKLESSWLDEAAIARRLRELSRDVAAWRLDRDASQLTLAGARPKTALLLERGRFGIPSARVATTHILKPAFGDLDGQAENEHFCLLLARLAGLPTASSQVMLFEDQVAIVVERFDRLRGAGAIARVHQEDLAQALGVPPTNKYENEGGPGARAIVDLLRQHSRHPEEDVTTFVLALAYGFMIAATDAHSKNYSLLMGAGGRVRLAPLYAVASALPHRDPHTLELAMRIGGTYRLRDIAGQQWQKLARELGLDPDEVVAGVTGLARALPDLAGEALDRCRKDGLHHSVLKRLVVAIRERSGAWLRATTNT